VKIITFPSKICPLFMKSVFLCILYC
jgi:hypothetical protein